MGHRPAHVHPDRPGLVRPVPVDPEGLEGPTRGGARGRRWRRSSHGLYVPSQVDALVPEQRIVEAAAVLPDFGGVTGWAALRWAGGAWFDGCTPDGRSQLDVVLATGYSDVRNQPGIRISQERLGPVSLTEVDGLAMTTVVRSLCFEMRYAVSVREAAVLLDMAAYSDLVSVREIDEYAQLHPGWTGIPRAREAIALGEENSWSPWESRMRLIWMLDAGLPRPLCNVPVFDATGRHIGTPDLLDPEAGVVGEYDGALHLGGAQRARDVRREEMFRAAGMEYFTMLRGDAANRGRMVDRMLSTRRRARFAATARRGWTIRTPAWWIPTYTVDQRRSLDQGERERLLRLRRRVG